MTGDNFETVGDFQPEFWPSEWHYEPQRMFGAIDAPDSSPAGAMMNYQGAHMSFPVSLVSARPLS